MSVVDGTLYLTHFDAGSGTSQERTFDGSAWSPYHRVGGISPFPRSAGATIGASRYSSYVMDNSGQNLYTEATPGMGEYSQNADKEAGAPGLAVVGGTLHCVFRTASWSAGASRLHHITYTPPASGTPRPQWSAPMEVPVGRGARDVALVGLGDTLYCLYRDGGSATLSMATYKAGTWTAHGQTALVTNSTVALAARGGVTNLGSWVYCFARSDDGTSLLWAKRSVTGTWPALQPVPGGGPLATIPAVTWFKDQLNVFYRH
ncbi:hypothetical protein ACFY8Z_35760 [Streptomyces microflavus]|uniref:hypothetical protein n=1 Tax=Streptomyces microflavus TaxID=1919 RepID=UPI0036E7F9A5